MTSDLGILSISVVSGHFSHSSSLWGLPGCAGEPVNFSLSAIDPFTSLQHFTNYPKRNSLATVPRHFVMLASGRSLVAFRCCPLAFNNVSCTSYVSCPVLRALPAETKVDD